MDILQIRYFSRVYETLNYAQAAEALLVSRQGLRKVVRNLEREVGQPLFVNNANRLQPTPAAHSLYAGSRAFMQGYKELEDSVTVMKLAEEQVIYLGSTYDFDSVFSRTEHRVFRSYHIEEHGPKAKIVYGRGSTPYLLESLLDGTIQYAHMVFSQLDQSLFDCLVSLRGTLYLTMNENHPLASRASVSIEELDGYPLSLFCVHDGVADAVVEEARRRDVSLNVVRWDSNQSVRLDDARQGVSATFTYRPVDEDDGPGLRSVPLVDPAIPWNCGVVAKKGMGDPYLMRFFAGQEIDWAGITELDLREGACG